MENYVYEIRKEWLCLNKHSKGKIIVLMLELLLAAMHTESLCPIPGNVDRVCEGISINKAYINFKVRK